MITLLNPPTLGPATALLSSRYLLCSCMYTRKYLLELIMGLRKKVNNKVRMLVGKYDVTIIILRVQSIDIDDNKIIYVI